MSVLTNAAKAAHKKTLAALDDAEHYSRFPVHEAAFWEDLFKSAKKTKLAQAVLGEIGQIESEPCIENDRVWRNMIEARKLAKLALLN